MNGKFVRVADAVLAAGTFVALSAAEQQSILRSANRKAVQPNIVNAIKGHMEWEDVVPGYLFFEGFGFPPFHDECDCLLEGVETAVGDPLPSCEPPTDPNETEKTASDYGIKITVTRE